MSTTVKTGWLNDKNGDKFAPKTLTSQVQTGDGTLLEAKIQADLDAAKTEILEESKKYTDDIPAVRHDAAQELTDEQKVQARQNIGAMEDADIQVIVTNLLGAHNTATDAHNDIRDLIGGLTTRLNTLADSDDTTLDQLSEIVAYIKSNKTLIEEITTSKVSVDNIVNNLTTNVVNKPLSAAMGVQLKALIDSVTGAVESVNGKTGAVILTHTDVGADKSGAASEAVSGHNSSTGAHADLFGKKLDKTGGEMSGALTLAADPTENLQAATKQYVDNHTQRISTEITDEATHDECPSAKAVKDYVDSAIGVAIGGSY